MNWTFNMCNSNSAYQYRQLNEKRLDMSNISRMSILSRAILKNAPYGYIKIKIWKILIWHLIYILL